MWYSLWGYRASMVYSPSGVRMSPCRIFGPTGLWPRATFVGAQHLPASEQRHLAPGLLDHDAVGLLLGKGGAHAEAGENQRCRKLSHACHVCTPLPRLITLYPR